LTPLPRNKHHRVLTTTQPNGCLGHFSHLKTKLMRQLDSRQMSEMLANGGRFIAAPFHSTVGNIVAPTAVTSNLKINNIC
jgi:hypothetical protein